MSRSGYTEDMEDNWALIRWRGAVMSAIRGKRGQEFLGKMLAALDAMPEKRLIARELENDGEVCALGSVGRAQGVDMSKIDPEDYGQVAAAFNIPESLAREIEYVNDEWETYRATPEKRFETVRKWVASQLAPSNPNPSTRTEER
jgi:hypothetical protein